MLQAQVTVTKISKPGNDSFGDPCTIKNYFCVEVQPVLALTLCPKSAESQLSGRVQLILCIIDESVYFALTEEEYIDSHIAQKMEDVENSLFSDRDQAANGDQDWQTEVWNLFKNLNSWQEESNNQFSNIINSYDKSIKKGIGELAQEVCDLKTQLSEATKVYRENYTTITDERNVLLETVKNLNDEIRQLNAKLLAAQTITAPEANNEALKDKASSKV